jgi:MFS family permease
MLSSTSLTMATSALVGLAIAPRAGLATLPLGISYLTILVALVPVSLYMQRFGRKSGFYLGACSGLIGGLLSGFAIYIHSFELFCIGAVFQGLAMSSAQFYRFAAAEIVNDDDYRSRAISWVLAGGLVAAFVGPAIATFTREIEGVPLFAASYSSIAILCAGILLFIRFIEFPQLEQDQNSIQKRPLGRIMLVPGFATAVLCAMAAYGMMNLLMTSTPLAMDQRGMAFASTATVIQWHIIGMFAPSFFTGHLIHRFGELKIMSFGILMLLTCIVISHFNDTYSGFLMSLIFLGLGWNFLYIGGTTLLTSVYQPAEKGLIQGINDLFVFSAVAVTALMSGYLHQSLGWAKLNLITLPALAVAAMSIFLLFLFYFKRQKSS